MSVAPRIERVSWGSVEVTGHGAFKDAKLWPGGARAWDWNETGTSHSPGIQPADADELLAHGAQVLILSRGHEGRLEVPETTVAALEDRGVEVQVIGTSEAVERYNHLAEEGAPVGALIHSTC